jgi:hypothetical protein
VDENRLPDIAVHQPIAVSAEIYPGESLVHFCRGYFSRIDDLTNTAVRNLEDILSRKNIALNPNAGKKLRIAVTSGYCRMNWGWGFDYYVNVRIKAGDSISEDIEGHNLGSLPPKTDINVSEAINEALLEMFERKTITEYLQN